MTTRKGYLVQGLALSGLFETSTDTNISELDEIALFIKWENGSGFSANVVPLIAPIPGFYCATPDLNFVTISGTSGLLSAIIYDLKAVDLLRVKFDQVAGSATVNVYYAGANKPS